MYVARDYTGKPRLTFKQRWLLLAVQEPALGMSITKLCEKVGITRRSFYNWMGQPYFREQWDQIHTETIKRQMPMVTQAMLARSIAGDVQAATLIAKLGRYLESDEARSQQTTQIQQIFTQINTALTPEQQAEFLRRLSPGTRAMIGSSELADKSADTDTTLPE